MKRIIIIFLSTLLFIPFLSSCGESEQETSSKTPNIDKIKTSGTLTLATSADYPPFESHSQKSGKDEIIGYDIDLAKAIADSLGVELKIQDISFDSVLASLATGQADIAIAGMGSNPERDKKFDHSASYYTTKNIIIVKKEDLAKYNSLASLEGKRVGAQQGTNKEDFVKNKLPSSHLISQTNANDLIAGLKSGAIDAVSLDSPVAAGFVENNPDLVVSNISIDDPAQDEHISVFFQKNKSDLLQAINIVIKAKAHNIYPSI